MGKWSNRLKFPLNSTNTTLHRNRHKKPTAGATTRAGIDTNTDTYTMVAISLYRGNMHRVPSELPRRWLMPTRKITLKDFRKLLRRRSKSLSLLPSSSVTAVAIASTTTELASTAAAVASTSAADAANPNAPMEQEAVGRNPNLTTPEVPMESVTVVDAIKVEDDNIKVYGVDLEAMVLDMAASLNIEEKKREEKNVAAVMVECEKERVNGAGLVVEIPVFEGNDKLDNADDKEKRKTEVEEKLKILNEKKHNLVQALKQILNAEEELKRRSCMQVARPPLPSQTDASNDSGSMTRHATPRTVSDPNITADIEGVEGDDALNPNSQSRPFLHTNSTSPSAESALRRPPYFHQNAAALPSRTSIVVTGSPSRFAPTMNQGQPSNLPSVSVTGTNYVASSPSPAASGGTSVFRDGGRHPSPWN